MFTIVSREGGSSSRGQWPLAIAACDRGGWRPVVGDFEMHLHLGREASESWGIEELMTFRAACHEGLVGRVVKGSERAVVNREA